MTPAERDRLRRDSMVGTVLLLAGLILAAAYAFYVFTGAFGGVWLLAIGMLLAIRGGWLLIRVGRHLP